MTDEQLAFRALCGFGRTWARARRELGRRRPPTVSGRAIHIMLEALAMGAGGGKR